MNRRDFLCRTGAGFGATALSALLAEDSHAAGDPLALAAKTPRLPAQAKAVIYLFLHGGVSHVDSFDPKPMLDKYAGKNLPPDLARTIKTSFIRDPAHALLRGSPWRFRPGGKSGLPVSDLFPRVRDHADDLVVLRGCHGDVFDHGPAMYLLSSGSQFPGRPSLGAWTLYGLGSESRDLPGYVVMSDGAMKSGPQVHGAGFLPSLYQGTPLRGAGDPILYLRTPTGVSDAAQKRTLRLVGELGRAHLAAHPGDSRLEARLLSYELAYRMQSAAPDAVDLTRETPATRTLYGFDDPRCADFGRKCLLARRMVERGVRFVQLFAGTNVGHDWDDAHGDLVGSHERMASKVDTPIAALLTDLKSRGLLDSTLVIWSGEFGRTPVMQGKNGRDHHPYGFSMWMAGAGIQGGRALGATDDFGVGATQMPIDAHDINATILRLLGIDHLKLTFPFQSRDMRLTDVHGQREFSRALLQA